MTGFIQTTRFKLPKVTNYVTLAYMNLPYKNIPNETVKASELSSWLLANGITAATTEELAQLLHLPQDHVKVRLARQRRLGAFVSPARGLWIPVPPNRRSWGAPEPEAYIGEMMSHLGCEYYVGWLSAASLHGASHQAVQRFQVATSKHVADRTVGRSRLSFLTRSRISAIPIIRKPTPAGIVLVSSVGATMMDLMEDLDVAGGLDNAVTVVAELAEEHSDFMDDAITAANAHSVTAVRRLGWVLESYTDNRELSRLLALSNERGDSPSLLSPHAFSGGTYNAKWNIFLNKEVDPDL